MLFSFFDAKGGAFARSFRCASGGRTTASPRLSLDRQRGSSDGELGAWTCIIIIIGVTLTNPEGHTLGESAAVSGLPTPMEWSPSPWVRSL